MRHLYFLLLAVLALAGCKTYPYGDDRLCQEIADFANSIPPGERFSVSLETSWGPSKNHPTALVSRDCRHDGYLPGAQLCDYLMENSAAEFSTNNFRRAFACLTGTPWGEEAYVSFERLDVKVSGSDAYGVRDNVKITIGFKPNAENGTRQLDIEAKAYEVPPSDT